MEKRLRGRDRGLGHGRSLLAGVLTIVLLVAVLGRRAGWWRDPNRLARAMYDLIAPIYDLWGSESGPLAGVRRELVEMLELEPGDQVLEVSVGTGANLPFICAEVGSSGRVYGLDLSEGMLAQARGKLAALSCPVILRQGLAEELPYPDNSFDAVLHLGGINFFTDRRRALEEMSRVAKPGARIVVADETVAPFDGFRALLGRAILYLVPRFRPPMGLVPDAHPELRYLGGGYIYVIAWRRG
jgi:ubiquinone/menaquinone biosynthesis C-methylase UbiE